MLVLNRREGERFSVDGSAVIVVTRTSKNRVSLGIEAEDSVRIMRGELELDEDTVLEEAHEIEDDDESFCIDEIDLSFVDSQIERGTRPILARHPK